MIGRRREDDTEPVPGYEPGDYGRWKGTWWVRVPNGAIGNVSKHTVVEHEDGTITVSPSILISGRRWDEAAQAYQHREIWHGWLERGVWRSC